MGYLFDLHVHTSESSRCGRTSAADVVERYIGLEYDGICITDHMNKFCMDRRSGTHEEKVASFLEGYRRAREAAGDRLKVILGMELEFLENDNEYLVFGFDEDFLFENNVYEIESLEDFRPFADEHKLAVFQAHPFREGMCIKEPKLLDGIEVYNGHGGHDSANEIAYHWAKRYGLRMSSSSDYHYTTDMEPGGVIFKSFPVDSADLAAKLLADEYTLKIWTE